MQKFSLIPFLETKVAVIRRHKEDVVWQVAYVEIECGR